MMSDFIREVYRDMALYEARKIVADKQWVNFKKWFKQQRALGINMTEKDVVEWYAKQPIA